MKHRRQGEYQAAEDAIEAMSRCMSKLQKLDQSNELVRFFTQQLEGDLQEAAANLINEYLKARVIRVLVEHGIRPDLDFSSGSGSDGKVISISVGKPN
jgi:recombinational DNA repair protein (RecF pathway)